MMNLSRDPANDPSVQTFYRIVDIFTGISFIIGLICAEKPFWMFCAQIVVITGISLSKTVLGKDPKKTLARTLLDNRLEPTEHKYLEILILLLVIVFPFRICALGNTRVAFYYAFVLTFLNSLIYGRENLFRRFIFLAYTIVVHFFSPSYQWVDSLILISFSLFLMITISLLVSQQNEMKKLFTRQSLHMSSIYHEIKTPMNGIVCANELILSNLEKLEEDQSPENMTMMLNQMREWLEISHSSSIALSEMIENMLTFSKLQTTQLAEVSTKPIQISEILGPIKHLISAYPKSSKVEVHIDNFVDQNVGVIASQVALHQILLNILTNSLKFTAQGDVSLVVEENKILKKIEFRISDTGIGMSRTFLEEHLFQPFEQEGQPLVNSQRGVGLGMALSKYMTDKMGGTIKVTSKKGEGTTTVVSLPSTQVEPVKPEEDFTKFESKRLELVKDGEILKALVVDDNETNRKVMGQVLRLVGFQCILAQSGEESIEILNNQKEEEIRVIFMDVFMPGMGGIEASKEVLKIISKWKSPPVLVGCTADTSESTIQACRNVGIKIFLHKPISRKALQKLILSL